MADIFLAMSSVDMSNGSPVTPQSKSFTRELVESHEAWGWLNRLSDRRCGLPMILDAFVSGVCGYCRELLLELLLPRLIDESEELD